MAKSVSSGLLKATLATALSLPERKIDYPHRVVQEAGEVSRGKRGKGGAGVTPRDAATTITAVACSFISDEVLKGVVGFNALRLAHTAHNDQGPEGWKEIDGGPWQCKGFKLPQLQSLPRNHTFADALAALIEAARDYAFEDAIKAAHPEGPMFGHRIEVVFWGPEPCAGIEVSMSAGNRMYTEEATYLGDRSCATVEDQIARDNRQAAFEIRIKIDHQSIYAVAKLFREDAA